MSAKATLINKHVFKTETNIAILIQGVTVWILYIDAKSSVSVRA